MTASYGKIALIRPTSEMGIVHITDYTGERKRVLVAGMQQKKLLRHERTGLEDVVEKVAGRRLPWRRPKQQIKLATIPDEDTYITERQLEELAGLLPKGIRLGRGRIKPVLIDAQPAVAAA
jgi:hypothetical protein